MAAPKGNQFWKIRSKHGRDKLFASPALLWDAACEYFEWCDANPLLEHNIELVKVNGIGDEVKHIPLEKLRPYTLHGLCGYLDCNTAYFRNFLNQEREDHEDFSSVIIRVEEIIYNQKFTGAATGFFNANIIARDLGLTDKTETKVDAVIKDDIDYDKLSDAALEEIANAKRG